MVFLIAGHNSAGLYLWPHLRDTGAIPKYINIFDDPLYNEAHECQKLCYQANKIEPIISKLCPFTYNLQGKIKWVNSLAKEGDKLIEVHFNSSIDQSVSGCEVFYWEVPPTHHKMLTLANKLSNIVSSTLRIPNRGAKKDTQSNVGRLAILRETKPLAFLIEMGFLSHSDDVARIRAFGVQALIDCIKYLNKN